ncbi:MAG: hypothetical protein RL322_1731 [Pseudomonadota bacterium]
MALALLSPGPVSAEAGSGLIYPAQVRPRSDDGCRDPRYTRLARFWELERESSCGPFRIRGYQPLSVALVSADRVNQSPQSPAPGRQTNAPIAYRTAEARIQLSVRTKLLSGLAPSLDPALHDSLWFAYSQQSYWQILSDELSRPFRSTDHQPELIYVYPLPGPSDSAWRVRFIAAGYIHHSNGQTLPLSRSWDRVYLMTAAENRNGWSAVARLWQRVAVGSDDDNPGIEDWIGRGEFRLLHQGEGRDAWALTLRHALASGRRGSVRLDWYRAIGDGSAGMPSNLRWQLGVFSGYGDSIVDYNFKRTVFSVGISLLDF